MIQRIQTVWLFVASVAAFLTLFLAFYSGTALPDNSYQKLTGQYTIGLTITTIALGVLTVINIFLFKTRKIQLRLCLLAILLDLLLIYLYYNELPDFTQGDLGIAVGLHAVILFSLFFATRGIMKDQKLVKDMDRLR